MCPIAEILRTAQGGHRLMDNNENLTISACPAHRRLVKGGEYLRAG